MSSSQPLMTGKTPNQSVKGNKNGSWVAPLIGLVLVLAAGGLAIYLINAIALQKPTAQISGNQTVKRAENVPAPDTAPPSITDLGVQVVSSNSVKIRWNTDEPSTSQVIWNAQNLSSITTPQKEAMVRQHSVELNNLATKTTFYYKVRSVDQAGNESVSQRMLFDIGKQPANVKIDVLMYSMYVESLPPAGTKTYVRGQVINNGDSPVSIKNVEIILKITVPGKGASELTAALDPYPEAINPGEAHKFYVIIPNGANPDYTVSARIVGQ